MSCVCDWNSGERVVNGVLKRFGYMTWCAYHHGFVQAKDMNAYVSENVEREHQLKLIIKKENEIEK
jgi:hypothetical protein